MSAQGERKREKERRRGKNVGGRRKQQQTDALDAI
jgi:hypothetical protein